MRLSSFIYLKQKKAVCLNMYKHTQAGSIEKKNHSNSVDILPKNETIFFYMFEAKKAVCWNMYKHTQAHSTEKTLKFIVYFAPK